MLVQELRVWPFYGEGGTILNGSRLLTEFTGEKSYWVASGQTQHGRRHGECMSEAPACNLPEGFFIDDTPLNQVLSKDSVKLGNFYLDYASDKLYFADDLQGRGHRGRLRLREHGTQRSDQEPDRLEVLERRSKGGNPRYSGCGLDRRGLVLEPEARCVPQTSITTARAASPARAQDIRIENDRIWANNIYGFDSSWEAGGLKLATSDGVALRGNHVYDNIGSGPLCDIGCRNVLYEGNIVEYNYGAGIFTRFRSTPPFATMFPAERCRR